MSRQYSQNYIDKFMERWGIFRKWVLISTISIIPICFVNLLNETIWHSLFVGFICHTGMIGMLISVIFLLIIYFVYDWRKIEIDSYVRMREHEEILREQLQRHSDRIREAERTREGLDEADHQMFAQRWVSQTKETKHFDEDLFKI